MTRNHYQNGTQMASSLTVTAATENKWLSRNTWQQSWGKGINKELKIKDDE